MKTTYWITLTIMISLALAGCSSPSPVEANLPPTDPLVPPMEANPLPTDSPIPPMQAITDTPKNPLQFGNTPESQEMPSNPPPVEKFVAQAQKDLAGRLGIETDQITVVKTEEMLWPDAALGCPAPGKVYAKGRVPGYKIWLEAGGVEYVYHTDLTGQVIYCPQINPDEPGSPLPGTEGPTPQIGVPIY